MLECIIPFRRKEANLKELYSNNYPKRRQPGKPAFGRLVDNLVMTGVSLR